MTPHSPSGLIAVDVNRPENASVREQFEAYRRDVVMAQSNSKLIANYTPQKFRIEDQLGTIVLLSADKGSVVGFQSVFQPRHWPEAVARVGNRSWIDPHFRANLRKGNDSSNSLAAASVVEFIGAVFKETLSICQQNGIELAVITRQNVGGVNAVLGKLAGRMRTGSLRWSHDNTGHYLTYDAPNEASCWQKIMYSPIVARGERHLALIPRITVDVYEVRFGNTGVAPFQ